MRQRFAAATNLFSSRETAPARPSSVAAPSSPNPDAPPSLRRAATDPSRSRPAQEPLSNGVRPSLGQIDELADDASTLPFAEARSPRSAVSPTSSTMLPNNDLLVDLLASQAVLELKTEPSDMLDPDMFEALRRVRSRRVEPWLE